MHIPQSMSRRRDVHTGSMWRRSSAELLYLNGTGMLAVRVTLHAELVLGWIELLFGQELSFGTRRDYGTRNLSG